MVIRHRAHLACTFDGFNGDWRRAFDREAHRYVDTMAVATPVPGRVLIKKACLFASVNKVGLSLTELQGAFKGMVIHVFFRRTQRLNKLPQYATDTLHQTRSLYCRTLYTSYSSFATILACTIILLAKFLL